MNMTSGRSRRRGYHLDAADKFSQGQGLLRIGDYQAAVQAFAVQAFSVAITLDPDHWTAYFRRAEAYRTLGMEEQANADLERAEFLMAAARASVGTTFGRIVGVIVGGIIGGIGGLACGYGLIFCSPVFGVVGAISGGIAGGEAAGGNFGCVGGCLAIIVGFLLILVIVGILSLFGDGGWQATGPT